ncbi:aminotransferase class V-fold PLP-dependent enzyme [Cyclobacteriaceae bacterium]|nr:aminotransferase class V-fold PLP-dependent enzyme [Cyclobacteriaceae bacterium]
MKVTSFYPGPATIHPSIPSLVKDAYEIGILSANHRSPDFMELSFAAKSQLRSQLNVPDDYDIIFISSATEAWEILPQSLTSKTSQHFFNGAFGLKWAHTTENLGVEVVKSSFDINASLPTDQINSLAEWLCITVCETSNGTMVDQNVLQELSSQRLPHQLIAVDATSALGGVILNFQLADYWFASCQKCLGLPAGLGLLIVSPAAIERGRLLGERSHYNSFLNLVEHARKEQTHYTPNVLNIYLLWRTLAAGPYIAATDRRLRDRMVGLNQMIQSNGALDWLVPNSSLRSPTVITLKTADPMALKERALAQKMILGNGYGAWMETTVRIANFPAMGDNQFRILMEWMSNL